MTDESQTSSGPGRKKQKSCFQGLWSMCPFQMAHCLFSHLFLDSPPKCPADSEAAPDSSSTYALHPALENRADNNPDQTLRTFSTSCTQPSAAITSTYVSLSSPAGAPQFQAQSPLSVSKPSSPSSSCPTLSPSPSPVTAMAQTSSLGQRRKGHPRKVRRNQKQRGRQSCTPAAREGDKRSEERMEEDIEMDEEGSSGETAAHQH